MTMTTGGDAPHTVDALELEQLRAAREAAIPDWATFAQDFYMLAVRAAYWIEDTQWHADFLGARRGYQEAFDLWVQASEAVVEAHERESAT